MLALLTTSITIIIGILALWITIGAAVFAVRFQRPTVWLLVVWGICQAIYDAWYLYTGVQDFWLASLWTLAIIAFFVLRTQNNTMTTRQLFFFWQ